MRDFSPRPPAVRTYNRHMRLIAVHLVLLGLLGGIMPAGSSAARLIRYPEDKRSRDFDIEEFVERRFRAAFIADMFWLILRPIYISSLNRCEARFLARLFSPLQCLND